jgi:hypothetical protein
VTVGELAAARRRVSNTAALYIEPRRRSVQTLRRSEQLPSTAKSGAEMAMSSAAPVLAVERLFNGFRSFHTT